MYVQLPFPGSFAGDKESLYGYCPPEDFDVDGAIVHIRLREPIRFEATRTIGSGQRGGQIASCTLLSIY